MPLSPCELPSIGPSRKRSFAQITQSESPEPHTEPPVKRRRTTSKPPSRSPSSTSFSFHTPVRFVGDGLDCRRPAMSGHHTSTPQSQTIDLTLDDTTSPESSANASPVSQIISPRSMENADEAPPLNTSTVQPEFIDLSALDDEVVPNQPTPISIASSPDLEFIGERVRTPVVDIPPSRFASRRLPLPIPAAASLETLHNIVRGAQQAIFGTLRFERDHNGRTRLESTPNHPRVTYDPAANLAIYEDVDLDYGVAGFEMGLPEEPTPARPDGSYKAPAPAKNGFVRTYNEDDILICGLCEKELAAGEDEVQAQVWVVKQCGHLYCGLCAKYRVISRGGGAKDRKRALAKKLPAFKTCAIPGCGKAVDSTTKMFQIYL